MKPIARAAAALFLVALPAALAAAPADAAKTPFEAHGVFASCGQGENRATVYVTFLSLRSERGFDDVKALLRHADEVRPQRAKIRFPGKDHARELRSIGVSLPELLFIDYLETKRGPGAAARERSTISWRSERSDARQRSSLRFNDLGKGFCERGTKDKAAVNERKLREEALEVEDRGDPGRPATKRQADASSVSCPTGTYYGRAEDGTELSFAVAPDGRVSLVKARASLKGLQYEVDLPDSNLDGAGRFHIKQPQVETWFGSSPGAELDGQCVENDRYQLTISDRAGTRSAQLSRNVLEPGLYEGNVSSAVRPSDDRLKGEIRFRIHPDGTVDNPEIRLSRFTYDKVRTDGPELVDPETGRNAWLGADRCQLGFSALRTVDHLSQMGLPYWPRPSSGIARLATTATCKLGNRLTGDLLNVPRPVFIPDAFHVSFAEFAWEARRVGD